MSISLRDQLLKAGLVNQKQAKQVGKRLKFHLAQVWTGDAPEGAGKALPGTVLTDPKGGQLLIQTGDGVLDVLRCQAPGKKSLQARQFLQGFPLPIGARFGSPEPS